jgi:hypothetical protein
MNPPPRPEFCPPTMPQCSALGMLGALRSHMLGALWSHTMLPTCRVWSHPRHINNERGQGPHQDVSNPAAAIRRHTLPNAKEGKGGAYSTRTSTGTKTGNLTQICVAIKCEQNEATLPQSVEHHDLPPLDQWTGLHRINRHAVSTCSQIQRVNTHTPLFLGFRA